MQVMRKLTHEFDEALMEEKQKQRGEMAGFLGRLKGMDDLMRGMHCILCRRKSKLVLH